MPHLLNAISAVDLSVLKALYALRAYDASVFFIAVSQLAAPSTTLGLLVLGFLILVHQRRMHDAAGFVIAVAGSSGIVLLIKELVERPRPDVFYQAYTETGYSFPSAHAAAAVALYGFLTYLAWRDSTSKIVHIITLTFSCIVILLVGFARLYLGVHYLSDVIAGYLVGGATLFISIQILKHWRETRSVPMRSRLGR